MAQSKRFPPELGTKVNEPLLYHTYQQRFLAARRLRLCDRCGIAGYAKEDGYLHCARCGQIRPNARRMYNTFGLFAGRRGAKTVSAALGCLEEIILPRTLGWVCGPSEKILFDSTMPTLLSRIPRNWAYSWDGEQNDLTLINGAKISFRSMHDPDRAHGGVGVHWTWWDEAAFIAEQAWHFFAPALTDYGGVAYFSSSVDGFDWTFDHVEKPALIEHVPGFWAAKWKTLENPAIMNNAESVAKVEADRKRMPPRIFRQEYEAERENFEGSVYGEWINDAWLADEAAVKEWIPEWPLVDESRPTLIGLDSGSDHPFGAVKLVITPKGIVATHEYLARERTYGTHITAIRGQMHPNADTTWAANLNESQLRNEFLAYDIVVRQAPNAQDAGRQRVASWGYSGQFKIAYTCPKTFDQMKKLRFADNKLADGQKRDKERVFKKDDELPDAVRYALMTYPQLPDAPRESQGRDLSKLPEKVRVEIERHRANKKRQQHLQPEDEGYPAGEFFQTTVDNAFWG